MLNDTLSFSIEVEGPPSRFTTDIICPVNIVFNCLAKSDSVVFFFENKKKVVLFYSLIKKIMGYR